MALSDVVRWFLPKEEHFFDYLENQALLAAKGATELAKFGAGTESVEVTQVAVQTLEHQGDAIVHELEEALAKTFVTPIDREDIQKLSDELDDILDLINSSARACALFGIAKATPAMATMMQTLVQCTKVVADAVPRIRKHQYTKVLDESRQIRKLEKEGDAVYRETIAELFRNPSVDAKQLIREREVLDSLERAVDHCDRVASTLANLAVKMG
jgi:uncharacterized protein